MLTDRNASMRMDVTDGQIFPGWGLSLILEGHFWIWGWVLNTLFWQSKHLRKWRGAWCPKSLLFCRCSGTQTGFPDEVIRRQATNINVFYILNPSSLQWFSHKWFRPLLIIWDTFLNGMKTRRMAYLQAWVKQIYTSNLHGINHVLQVWGITDHASFYYKIPPVLMLIIILCKQAFPDLLLRQNCHYRVHPHGAFFC